MKNDNEKYIIATVETALKVLEAITEFDDGFTIADLSEKIGISKSKTYRYIETLKKSGYITKTNLEKKYNSKYKVGFSAYETGFKLVSSMDLYTKAKPVLADLVRETDETAYLVIEKNGQIVFLDKVDTNQRVNTKNFTGTHLPLENSAAGTIILANNKPDHALTESLLTVKEQGYSMDKNVLGRDVSSLAAPVLDDTGKAIASICLVAPSYRLGPDSKATEKLRTRLRIAAERISYGIGYRNHNIFTQYKPITPHSSHYGLGQTCL